MIIQESDWYIAALLWKMPPIHEDSAPEAGFYKVRLESRGAFYPARVWIEEERDDVGDQQQSDDLRQRATLRTQMAGIREK